MRSALTLLVLALVGLFGATSIGYAAYVVSRDSVGLPVTKLKLSPDQLAPAPGKRAATTPTSKTTPTVTTPRTTTDDHGGRTTTDDDRSGRSSNSGKGSDDSGHGGDDD